MNELKIFISYSHNDSSYLDLLMTHLNYLEKNYSFRVWSDKDLKLGVNWSKKITQELDSSNIAILLISHHFLISDFILKVELPSILKNAQKNGTKVIPIILSHCMFDDYPKLSSFQAINPPNKPLEDMKNSEINRIFKNLTWELKENIALKRKKNLGLPEYIDNKFTIIQLSILRNLQEKNFADGLTISEIQKQLKTDNRKGIVNSLDELTGYELIKKQKNDNKTKFKITTIGSHFWQEIKDIIGDKK